MMARRTLLTALAAAGLIATGATSAPAAPTHGAPVPGHAASTVGRFGDGSFEYPVSPAKSFRTYTIGQSLGPWKVTSGTVDLIGDGFWQAAEGIQSVDLNGIAPGALSQTFTTTPGRTYTVTYALAGNPGLPEVVKTGQVLVDGQVFQHFTFDVTGKSATDMGYVRRQVTFQATRSTTTLTFASTTRGTARGPVIDDVQVRECSYCPDF
ncbi:hypothetical protein AAW14_14920 [Streptomyces hygroscopicus]|uniref:choice-of-anchor C family protein n=1 Tax=Streptomyces hygroscopicus TaxID=1912 RepID=UPI00223EB4A4|nr:choice-of-anchor C family protein [Streptomyces hygroscopicus]MCW7943307.1 hypothetical protein [Streptomyces hygroscopicus]